MTPNLARRDPTLVPAQTLAARHLEKPWGFEAWWVVGPYVLKQLHVRAGQRLSLQYHLRKTETLVVHHGRARVTVGDETHDYRPGEVIHIPAGVTHRIAAHVGGDTDLFEVSTPELWDVVRLEDDFGRALGTEVRSA